MNEPVIAHRRPSSFRYYRDGPPDVVHLGKWRLRITGAGVTEEVLDYEALKAFPHVIQDRRMVCVCNWSVRHRWGGVLLSTLLAEVGWNPDRSGAFLRQTSLGTMEKGTYSSTVRIIPAIERDALLVDTVDDRPLPLERGFPLRLVDFALYGYKGVKGLTSLDVTDRFDRGYWEDRYGYDKEGLIRPKRYRACDLGHMILAETPGEIGQI